MLHDASLMLRHLPETSEMLSEAANSLLKLPDQLVTLEDLLDPTATLGRLAGSFEERLNLAVTLAGRRLVQDFETAQNQFVPPLEPVQAHVAPVTPTSQTKHGSPATASATVIRPHWKYFRWGAVVGATGLLALLLGAHWLVDYLRI